MKINILLPVYNDWGSLNLLLEEIQKIKKNKKSKITSIDITIINDYSSIPAFISKKNKRLNIKILELKKNVGSQLAINIGLKYLDKYNNNFDYFIVMDSDGEDKAKDIVTLLEIAKKNKNRIIFASRGKRQDGFLFYILYKIYLFIFILLTGKNINFGNFSCIPKNLLNDIKNLDNSKIHHSASILRSNLAFDKIKCDRGKRFMGKSKMSLKNLILHGLNGLALFFNSILKRFFIFLILLIILGTIVNLFLNNFELNSFFEILIKSIFQKFDFIILVVLLIFILMLSVLKIVDNKIKKFLKIIEKTNILKK